MHTPLPHTPLRSVLTRTAAVAATSAAVALTAVLPAPAAKATPAPTAVTAPAVPSAAAPVRTLATIPVVHLGPRPAATPVATPALRGSSALTHALRKLGSPYVWGATGPNSFDCSGLVKWAYQQVGVSLPRTSRAMSGVGTPVPRSRLQPGDLVFFYQPVSHVGIYVGNGKVVHASTSGQPVKVSSLSAMPFNSARRV